MIRSSGAVNCGRSKTMKYLKLLKSNSMKSKIEIIIIYWAIFFKYNELLAAVTEDV